MRVSEQRIEELAGELWEAERTRRPIAPLSHTSPELGDEEAYAIQLANVARSKKAGRRLVGYKVGLTSREAQKQFGVFEPDFGHLYDSMHVLDGACVDLTRLIQPKIEGEIALVLGEDLSGPGITMASALRAVDFVTGAVEIVDSRIRDWKIRAVDTIADNGSSALFALSGAKVPLERIDLPTIGMCLAKNGETLVTGAGAAVLGNPVAALVFLANQLARQGLSLHAGDTVLSGSLGSMLSVAADDVFSCSFLSLGTVRVRFTGDAARPATGKGAP